MATWKRVAFLVPKKILENFIPADMSLYKWLIEREEHPVSQCILLGEKRIKRPRQTLRQAAIVEKGWRWSLMLV